MPYTFGKLAEKKKGSLITIVSPNYAVNLQQVGSLNNFLNIIFQNYKRVIEVWFDDKYKEFFYTREPMARYLDMGNITAQLEMKKRLNCKSFAWFMKEIAYDVLEKYPELPPNVHWGEASYKSYLFTKISYRQMALSFSKRFIYPKKKTVLVIFHIV